MCVSKFIALRQSPCRVWAVPGWEARAGCRGGPATSPSSRSEGVVFHSIFPTHNSLWEKKNIKIIFNHFLLFPEISGCQCHWVFCISELGGMRRRWARPVWRPGPETRAAAPAQSWTLRPWHWLWPRLAKPNLVSPGHCTGQPPGSRRPVPWQQEKRKPLGAVSGARWWPLTGTLKLLDSPHSLIPDTPDTDSDHSLTKPEFSPNRSWQQLHSKLINW